mgnify:CR=1 FL=1
MTFFTDLFKYYKDLNIPIDPIPTPSRDGEDFYFDLKKNNSDDSLSFTFQINSNIRNEELNPSLLSNFLNEEITIEGTTQIPVNPENNNYPLGRNPILIQLQQNEDSDNNFNENSLDNMSFQRVQSNSNNRK